MTAPKKYAAVFTDSRPLMNLDQCAIEHMKYLPSDWDCLFFTSSKNAYVTKVGAKVVEIPEETTDTYEKFNQYRVSADFWKKLLEYDRVLIFEQDTRILRTGIEEFLEWEYVGAPWPAHYTWHEGNCVGNGGLSLRSPAAMLKVSQACVRLADMHEDHFLALNMKKMGVKVAPVEVAEKFACESIYKLGTFGCHAIGKYMTPEQVGEIMGQYNKRTLSLKELVGQRLASELPMDEKIASIGARLQSMDERMERVEGLCNSMKSSSKNSGRRIRWEESFFAFWASRIRKYSRYPIFVYKQYEPCALLLPRYRRPKLKKYPSIAIVTPSYNQGQFIADTIKSVMEQGYPNLSYYVQDGNSSDNTMAVVASLAKQFHFGYESQKDKGQADAIKKGFGKMSGDIMAYLNSDDLLGPDALYLVADYFNRHPEVDVVFGDRIIIDEKSRETGRWYTPQYDADAMRYVCAIPQETMFWRRGIYERCGGIDETFQFAMDWDLELRMRKLRARFVRLPYFMGCFRVHPSHKSSAQYQSTGLPETEKLLRREFGGKLPDKERVQYFGNYEIVRSFLHRVFGGFLGF